MGTVVDDAGGVRRATVEVLTRRGDDEQTALGVATATVEGLRALLGEVSDSRRGWAPHRELRRLAVRDAVAEAVVVAVQRLYLAPDADPHTGVLRLDELRALRLDPSSGSASPT